MNINLVGCGKSIELFDGQGDFSIGINSAIHYTDKLDALFLFDPKESFQTKDPIYNWDRVAEIEQFSDSGRMVLAVNDDWSYLNGFVKVHLNEHGTGSLEDISPDAIPHLHNSAYCLTFLTLLLWKPDTITLYGIDFSNYHGFYALESKEEASVQESLDLTNRSLVIEGFMNVNEYCKARGIKLQVASKDSILFPYLPLKED